MKQCDAFGASSCEGRGRFFGKSSMAAQDHGVIQRRGDDATPQRAVDERKIEFTADGLICALLKRQSGLLIVGAAVNQAIDLRVCLIEMARPCLADRPVGA